MLRTVTFGDLVAGRWGAVWDLSDAGPGFALLGNSTSDEAPSAQASIDGSDPDNAWQITGPGIELEASPEGPAGGFDGGFEQLIRIRGRWTTEDSERAVECLGRRGVREAIDPGRFETVRDVSAWFEPDLLMALVAARPRGSASHADDVLSACVLEDRQALQVSEPRLSTTYTASGLPVRASFEMWLEHHAEEEKGADGEAVEHFPRRGAGEALGAQGSASDDSLEVHAELFRWHARGREGAGVYVLARLSSA